jgi:hypothetical protein
LYDRLAEAAAGLPPDRLEALKEHLDDEQAKERQAEQEHDQAGGGPDG